MQRAPSTKLITNCSKAHLIHLGGQSCLQIGLGSTKTKQNIKSILWVDKSQLHSLGCNQNHTTISQTQAYKLGVTKNVESYKSSRGCLTCVSAFSLAGLSLSYSFDHLESSLDCLSLKFPFGEPKRKGYPWIWCFSVPMQCLIGVPGPVCLFSLSVSAVGVSFLPLNIHFESLTLWTGSRLCWRYWLWSSHSLSLPLSLSFSF